MRIIEGFGFPGGSAGRIPAMQEMWVFDPWVGRSPEEEWQPTPGSLPEESRTEGPDGLLSIESQEPDMTVVTEHAPALRDPELTVPDLLCFLSYAVITQQSVRGGQKE